MKRFAASILSGTVLIAGASCSAADPGAATFPLIPEEKIPIVELRVSDTSYAAVRKPPGDDPLPAVIFLHGGLGQSSLKNLRVNAVRQPTQARFLAWGYVTVNATRRANRHDPGDRGVVEDVLGLLAAVRKLPYVDAESVFLYGGSGGGTLALEVASVSNDVTAVVAGEPATIIYMGMFTREHIVLDANGKPTKDRRWDVMNADAKQLYTPELREHTRRKLEGLDCPVLILHGDVHALKKFNLGVFIPEMRALGKSVVVRTYPGEPHGFYWGKGRDPAQAERANREAERFLREHGRASAKPISGDMAQPVKVEPMKRPDNN